ncbi:DUF6171 family protein [Paenibacillus chondroitinus]|uniref:DUF6171 family protein n=1 Tax=Paenibacillus chondroitinus TaxID=59842 RepID=A0ABU6DAL3_9BACL|nr:MULTISPECIES: DUF6171 family protein [Paenibacillus]MCY9656856.1 DUF6171 family protein [Paenibacillus anseongense]MEB4794506.1 DUF6171 family protein [Paenibacillus chondroitinus]
MLENRQCKGCREEFKVTAAQIDKMLRAPMFQSAEACVPDSVYRERLSRCSECPKLVSGHTCSLCGCIVRIAAKLRDKSCPYPGGTGWQRYNA